MLCVACERHRFPECFTSSNSKTTASKSNAPESRKGQQQQQHQNGGTLALSSTDGRSSRPSESIAASSGSSMPQNQIQIVASPSRLNNVMQVVLNELLSYVNVYRNCSNVEALTKVVLNYFSQENIAESKRLLVQEFYSLTGVTQYLTDRRNSSVRPAHEAGLDNIIGTLDVADTVNALNGYLFVAANLQAMPKYGP